MLEKRYMPTMVRKGSEVWVAGGENSEGMSFIINSKDSKVLHDRGSVSYYGGAEKPNLDQGHSSTNSIDPPLHAEC